MLTIVQTNVGQPASLGMHERRDGTEVEVFSALVKRQVNAPMIGVGPLGLEGDSQVDKAIVKGKQVHGGPLKAIYAMTLGTQARWRSVLGEAVSPGIAFGENLTLAMADAVDGGIDEARLYIGDEFTCNGVVLRVTGSRRPCYKLGMRLCREVPRAMTRNGWTGWYFEVVQPGEMPTTAATLQLVNRRAGMSTIAEAFFTKMRENDEVPGMREQDN